MADYFIYFEFAKEAIDDSSSFGQYILTGSVTDNSKSDEIAGAKTKSIRELAELSKER